MTQDQARQFVAKIESEITDETEPTYHSPPVNMPKGKRAQSLNETAGIVNAANKIIDQLKTRINAGSSAEQLNQQVTVELGRGIPELVSKAEQSKLRAKQECLEILHRALSWLTAEEKVVDVILSKRVEDAYHSGKKAGLEEAGRVFKEELQKVKAGMSPLERSINERLGSK